jgi:hypothetical protein
VVLREGIILLVKVGESEIVIDFFSLIRAFVNWDQLVVQLEGAYVIALVVEFSCSLQFEFIIGAFEEAVVSIVTGIQESEQQESGCKICRIAFQAAQI